MKPGNLADGLGISKVLTKESQNPILAEGTCSSTTNTKSLPAGCRMLESLLNVKIETFFWALLIIPFFEPWSTDVLSHSGYLSPIVSGLSVVAMTFRVLVSFYAFVSLLILKKQCARFFVLPLLFSGGMLVSAAMNHQLALSTVSLPIQYAGFTLLLMDLYARNPRRLFQALCFVFLILALMGFASIYIMHGLLPSNTAAGIIYSFGGKNSLFITFAPVILLIVLSEHGRGKISWRASIASLVFAFTAYFIDSSGSMVCFALALIAFIPISRSRYLFQLANPWIIIALIVIVFFGTVVTSVLIDAFTWLFELVNRESNFTNRDLLWNSAIMEFVANPLFGVGPDNTYSMAFQSGEVTTTIAHSYYLDVAAKYGIVALAPFVLDILMIVSAQSSDSVRLMDKSGFSSAGIIMLIIVFHSCFDDLILYFYAVVRLFAFAGMLGTSTRDDSITRTNNER